MNEFIKKMLELGAELDQSTTGIEANLIINDAEILYLNHIKQLTLTDVGYPLCACGGNERIALDCTRKRCEHPKYAKSST
jgi:hypothetical protein